MLPSYKLKLYKKIATIFVSYHKNPRTQLIVSLIIEILFLILIPNSIILYIYFSPFCSENYDCQLITALLQGIFNHFLFFFAVILFNRQILAFISKKIKQLGNHFINKLDKHYHNPNSSPSPPDCLICQEKPQSTILPCGHSGICYTCSFEIANKPCPICRYKYDPTETAIHYLIYDTPTYHKDYDTRPVDEITSAIYSV